MVKKQRALLTGNYTLILLGVIIILSFMILSPKVSSVLFPFKRQTILSTFLSTTEKNHTINPQSFWKFREFYSPGYYTVNKNGLPHDKIFALEKRLGVGMTGKSPNVFLSFTSPRVISLEALVTEKSLAKVVDTKNIKRKAVLFAGTNQIIFTDTKGNMFILFLKPLSQMETANGFFDYKGIDTSLVNGKNWLDITMVSGH